MNTIDIGIKIDKDKLLRTSLLFQAGSNGGKSWGFRRIVESIGNSTQQIIIDPEGEFASLREKFDFLLIGKDGDIPLNVRYAETLANMILETGVSVIIDLYELTMDNRILFVKNFINAMVNADKKLWHDCFIYIDEAHIFCPEDKTAASTQAVIDLCTRGRKRGFGRILATQRLPLLNKNATAQCYNKIIGLNTQDIDRKRAGEELGMNSKAEILSLRDLQTGEFYAFGPAISKEVTKFKVSQVITSHQEAGGVQVAKTPTPKAVAKLLSKFADIPEEAEKDLSTKQQLQAEVTRLRGEVTRLGRPATHSATKPSEPDPAKLQRSIDAAVNQAKAEFRKHYESVIKERDGMILSGQAQIRKYLGTIQKINELSGGGAKLDITLPTIPKVPKMAEPDIKRTPIIPPGPKRETTVPKRETVVQHSGTLGKCAKAILSFLASFSDRDFTKVQVAIATGYSVTSGGFRNSLSELNTKGFIITGNRIKHNPEAWDQIVGEVGPIYETAYDLETFKKNLGKCELEIYEVLLEHPHDGFTKEELSQKTVTAYSPESGGFRNSISRLNTLELIAKDKSGIRLNPELLELIN